jgi:Thrombospondin type 3 repeat
MGMRRIVLLLASMAVTVVFGGGVVLADSPTTKEDCKNGGYAKYGFKNQGQCIKAVSTAPPPDADNDGVPDANDNCINVPNANQADLDNDGQGDVCDNDRDGDGVNNDADSEPDNPAIHVVAPHVSPSAQYVQSNSGAFGYGANPAYPLYAEFTDPNGTITTIGPVQTYNEEGNFQFKLGGTSLQENVRYDFRFYSATEEGVRVSPYSESDRLTIDDTPPNGSITSGPNEGEGISTNEVTFTWEATDNGSMNISQGQLEKPNGEFVNGQPSEYSGTDTFSNLADGTYSYRVYLNDAASNRTVLTRTFTIDTTPPALETTILSSPDSPMNDNEAIFTFESNRPGSRFECRFRGPAHPPWNPDFPDQGFQDCQSPWTISFLNIDPQGSHYFEVRAVDSDGNVDSTPAQAQFIRDTEAPTSYIERTTQSGSPFGGGTINFNDVNFQGYNVSHREYDSERFFCRLIGPGQSEEYVDCTTSGNRFFVHYNDLQNGSYQFAVYGVDAAGNVQASNTQDSFIVNVP